MRRSFAMAAFGQFAATSQFYIFGRLNCTQTGYKKHVAHYKDPNILNTVDLAGKVFMVTGANQGIGKEIVRYVASRGAAVYMVCRSADKAEDARRSIVEQTPGAQLHILQGDCGLQRDMRRIWKEFESTGSRLDGLVCNAGAMLDDKTLTAEGVEVTLATHLLCGTYLLGSLALPALTAAGGRLVIVSSGGMYNTKFPDWNTASALAGEYNGEMAYAYMKRGQVLLAERWAEAHPAVKVVSAHPGWAGTEAVDKAYANPDSKSLLKKSYLEPLRTPWEGAEGICWLLACPPEQVETGAFYLDREPQVKHMAGPFFYEGSFTKNTAAEVDAMMTSLENAINGQGPSIEELLARHEAFDQGHLAKKGKLKAMEKPIDVQTFMGKWYVIGHIPTFIDKNTANCTETYVWNEAKQQIDVTFSYMDMARTKSSTLSQIAKVVNPSNTEWKLTVPTRLVNIPVPAGYLILHCEDDYSACIVGDPSKYVLYIMGRSDKMESATYERMKNISESLGYNRALIKDVPQVWN